jgi:hypothetical protein
MEAENYLGGSRLFRRLKNGPPSDHLGHELIETTQTDLYAHLALKEKALAKLKPYEKGKRTVLHPASEQRSRGRSAIAATCSCLRAK